MQASSTPSNSAPSSSRKNIDFVARAGEKVASDAPVGAQAQVARVGLSVDCVAREGRFNVAATAKMLLPEKAVLLPMWAQIKMPSRPLRGQPLWSRPRG